MDADTRVILTIWIASGVLGILFRLLLFVKYSYDLRAARKRHRSNLVQSVSIRGIESCVVHGLVKLSVLAIGVQAWMTPGVDIPTPLTVPVVGLLAIPWLLTLDGVREYFHQRAVLRGA